MSGLPAIGGVVWHDLLTNKIDTAARFYADVFGWTYRVEHATNSAWKTGEADYPLIVADGLAHGGFVDPGPDVASHWLAYVQVPDVDVAVAWAAALGGVVDRAPFDVPGVGRSAVIQDRQGAAIAVHVPTHKFPPPTGVFDLDRLVTQERRPAEAFYSDLFDWRSVTTLPGDQYDDAVWQRPDGARVARMVERRNVLSCDAFWVPVITAIDVDASVDRALALGANLQAMPCASADRDGCAVLRDPTGAIFGIQRRAEKGEAVP